MRKSAVHEAGGYDVTLRARQAQGCEDIWKLFHGIAEKGHFALVPDYLTGYRQAPEAMSRNVAQMLRSDALVRSDLVARYPEYSQELDSGRRSYVDWVLGAKSKRSVIGRTPSCCFAKYCVGT